MEIQFETNYNQKTMTTMAKTLRKTLRKDRNRRTHIFGWIIVMLSIFIAWDGFRLDFRYIVTCLAIFLIVFVLIWEDQVNGFIARKRILTGTERTTTVFSEDGYCSTTELGKTEWNYDKIMALAETKEYFVFIFSTSHAQVYDKNGISGGTVQEFRSFIESKTKKKVTMI